MRFLVSVVIVVLAAGAAHAQETITYQYDALGRLVASSVSGGPNGQVQTTIVYDAAGNRTTYSVNGPGLPNGGGGGGATVPPASPQVIVVPLNGFTVIPISN